MDPFNANKLNYDWDGDEGSFSYESRPDIIREVGDDYNAFSIESGENESINSGNNLVINSIGQYNDEINKMNDDISELNIQSPTPWEKRRFSRVIRNVIRSYLQKRRERRRLIAEQQKILETEQEIEIKRLKLENERLREQLEKARGRLRMFNIDLPDTMDEEQGPHSLHTSPRSWSPTDFSPNHWAITTAAICPRRSAPPVAGPTPVNNGDYFQLWLRKKQHLFPKKNRNAPTENND